MTILFLWSEPDQLVYFIRTSLLIALLVSIAGIFLIPERALHQISEATTLERAFAGLWKGGWAHKNQAGGSIMFLAAISAALFWLEKKWWILVIFILSSIFLWNSNSITAIVAVPLGLLPLFGMLALHRWPLLSNLYSAVLTLTFIGFPFLVVGYLYPEYGFDFSQRSFIWQSVIRYTDLHPILGGGYASVFTIPNGIKYFDSAYFLRVIGHAHSGVMEAYSQLGWVGLAILATMVFMAQTSLAQLLRTESVEQKPYVQILTWCFYLGLIRCVTEPDFLNPRANTVMFLLLMMAPTFMLFRMKAGQTSPLKLLNRLGPAGNQD
ncbi:O-antigen ligase family protein [Devosia submarina]|uniref:O-antigen ligase family protein n=1 Tax=Devosia submarina TaxID=1173082 RepID=UPI00130061DC|nr:O-antigen ligase family protein [Devosia submarina]